MSLPRYMYKVVREIEEIAHEAGLDFFQTSFEMVNYRTMNQLAAYEGFPTRYPHWRFGMEYERLSKSYAYGLHKIYEMVINNDPCYAYLLEGNSLVDQRLVITHVFAHCDFFKSNAWFEKTNRKMIDEMANHATRIRGFVERYGLDKVEEFLDVCLSIDNLIDVHSPFIVRSRPDREVDVDAPVEVTKLEAKSYMDSFINPPAALEAERKRLEAERDKQKRFPPEPVKDVTGFLLQHAPLAPWERATLEMMREESYYFAPQRQTKIMNEGWASFWHSRLMTTKILTAAEIVDFADHHSMTVQTSPYQLNPYALGLKLFRDIEDRWNRGAFGKEYDECDDIVDKEHWNRRLGLGLDKIYQVRRIYNDIMFVDEFLTPDFAHRSQMFTFEHNRRSGNWEIASRKFAKIKEKILVGLTNFGQPEILVEDGNHENKGELLLRHRHEGVDLRRDYGTDTLRNICRIWRRPVNLLTVVNEKTRLWRHDGKEFKEKPA